MSNGLKNIQLHARAYAQKELLGSGLSSMALENDKADDSDDELPGIYSSNLSMSPKRLVGDELSLIHI